MGFYAIAKKCKFFYLLSLLSFLPLSFSASLPFFLSPIGPSSIHPYLLPSFLISRIVLCVTASHVQPIGASSATQEDSSTSKVR